MKLCVTSTGKDLDSTVDLHFGRAPYFLIINTDTMDYEAVESIVQVAGQGSGISAAQLVLDKGAAAVLTGIIGPNAFDALRIAHVEIYEGLSGNDTVRTAIDKFKKGQYSEAEAASGGSGRKRHHGGS